MRQCSVLILVSKTCRLSGNPTRADALPVVSVLPLYPRPIVHRASVQLKNLLYLISLAAGVVKYIFIWSTRGSSFNIADD